MSTEDRANEVTTAPVPPRRPPSRAHRCGGRDHRPGRSRCDEHAVGGSSGGVTHAAATYHFGDKAGLLTAVAAEGYRLLGDDLDAVRRTQTSFLEVGVVYVRFAVEHRAHFEVMYRHELYRPDSDEVRRARARTARILYGTDHADEEQLAAGVAAWAIVHGVATLWLVAPSAPAGRRSGGDHPGRNRSPPPWRVIEATALARRTMSEPTAPPGRRTAYLIPAQLVSELGVGDAERPSLFHCRGSRAWHDGWRPAVLPEPPSTSSASVSEHRRDAASSLRVEASERRQRPAHLDAPRSGLERPDGC